MYAVQPICTDDMSCQNLFVVLASPGLAGASAGTLAERTGLRRKDQDVYLYNPKKEDTLVQMRVGYIDAMWGIGRKMRYIGDISPSSVFVSNVRLFHPSIGYLYEAW